MKIAIQGHPTRGKEVIQILESLGGINRIALRGNSVRSYYYINYISNNLIDCQFEEYINEHYKKYTLEEFEKEFPFKVGDKVIDYEGDVATITGFAYIEENLGYSLQYENGRGTATPRILTPYKEMKEKRNITLTLDKAKEWYKKGGELKEIALQAFTEKELIEVKLPESWEEFCNNSSTKNGECYIGACSEMHILPELDEGRDVEMDKNVCPSQKSAEAHLAMIQLEQLRDCYRGLFVTVRGMPVWSISIYDGKPHIFQTMWGKNHSFLTFQSKEVAEKYLRNFKPLIEKAGDLI